MVKCEIVTDKRAAYFLVPLNIDSDGVPHEIGDKLQWSSTGAHTEPYPSSLLASRRQHGCNVLRSHYSLFAHG